MDKNTFFKLLRFSLGLENSFDEKLSPEDWMAVYDFSYRQALLGVVYQGVKQLKGEFAPPFQLALQWTGIAERIRGKNEKFYAECGRLTKLFAEKGRKTAILKGQANSLLYPDKFSRQPGDIDIFVEGGKDSVVKLLDEMKMFTHETEKELIEYHHVHLKTNEQGIDVEVHFRPSSGVLNPFCNKRLQNFLLNDIKKTTLTEYAFYSPSIKFALAMQLAHLLRHFEEGGVGLRQIIDYYMLLKNADTDDRNKISEMLDTFGIRRFTSALMYVLKDIFGLDENLMLCKFDEKYGKKMLDAIFSGGNFGWYRENRPNGNFSKPMEAKVWSVKMASLYPREISWYLLNSVRKFFVRLPARIKYRTWSLKGV